MSDQLASEESPLPKLREDIRLLPGPESNEGAPTWAIFDPVRNRYFRIDWSAFELLSRWDTGTSDRLLHRVATETTCEVTAEDIRSMVQFLYANNLTLSSPTDSSSDYVSQYEATQSDRLSWLMRNYLFLRFPLVNPDTFLQRIAPHTEFLFSKWSRNVVFVLGLIGILLINQQWTAFTNTFLYFFTIEGLLIYLLALVFVKVCHELGHALTATRAGCRVASMGVAFLVLFPVLFTDTTDAYRLTSRRSRLYISAAGILTEFYLALICLFLWGVLPDGVLRSVVFVIGTISFSLTVFINLNPFLRFDGYYFLADWLGMENLQERSFALGRWKLRELLFDLGDPAPEPMPATRRRFLIGFAWATWAYRFLLLSAIALIVYHFFFKLLGLILFLGVIYTFLLNPIFRELTTWWYRRDNMSRYRGSTLLIILGSLLLAFLIPWRSTITAPAILEPAETVTVYPPAAGRIADLAVFEGDYVSKGDTLVTLESPRLADELKRVEIEISIIELSLDRIAASSEELQNLQVLQQRLQEKQSTESALRAMQEQLVLKSPINGRVVELADSLHEGRWINADLAIAYLVNDESLVVKGVVQENDLTRVAVDQSATFIADDATIPGINGLVSSIERANLSNFDIPYLASTYGGDVAVRSSDKNELVPETAVYRLQFSITREHSLPDQVVRGVAKIDGERKSLARRSYELIAAAIVRGSAF